MSENQMDGSNRTNAVIGQPVDRVDGRLKVTGGARYSAEYSFPNMAHACLVQSTVASGRIRSIDTRVAERAPGVLGIITHLNAPRLRRTDFPQPGQAPKAKGLGLLLLQDDIVRYCGQHIGVVVADTLERATHAAQLIRVQYDEQ